MKRWFFSFALPAKRALDAIVGSYRSHYHGSGTEFSTIREYAFGDDARRIDPRVSAKAGEAYIRLFQEDKAASFLFCLDAGSTMRASFQSDPRMTKYAKALEVFEYLAYSAIDAHDKIEAIAYGCGENGDWITDFPPAAGENESYRVVEGVRRLHDAPLPRLPGQISQALDRLLARPCRRRSICFFTDEDIAGQPNALESLGALALKNDVTVCFVADAWEAGDATGAVWNTADSALVLSSDPDAVSDTYERTCVDRAAVLASHSIRSFSVVVGRDTGAELLRFLGRR